MTHPLLGATLAVGGRLFGGSGGHHHGLRIVVLVVVVAAVLVGAVLLVLQRSRARRNPRGHEPSGDDTGAVFPDHTAAASTPNATGRGGRRAHPNTVVVNGLTKRYGEKLAVEGLSFDVTPGKVTGFLGPNGAGKSTTMRLILGLDRPDRGSASVNGRPYHDLAWPLHEVGALLEAKATHPGRTAHAHLLMLAKTNRIPRRRVDDVLGLVGLSAVADRPVGGFSLGMGQRLGIAVALLGDPGIVILDEPVNGLDTDGIRWVRQLLRRLANEGRSVFVSSHLMAEMAQTADQLVVIGQGHLIAEMPISEFTTRYGQGHVKVSTPQIEQLRPELEKRGATVTVEADRSLSVRNMDQDTIGEIAWQHHIMLTELSPQAATLEQAFVESTQSAIEFGGEDARRPRTTEPGSPT